MNKSNESTKPGNEISIFLKEKARRIKAREKLGRN